MIRNAPAFFEIRRRGSHVGTKNAPGVIQINARALASRHKRGMDTATRIKPAVEGPLCPSCGRPMRFVRSVPRLGALPELRTFECKACGVTYTEAVERAAAAWADEE